MTCEWNECFNLQLKSLLDHIKADWERTRSRNDIKIMRKYAASARLITILFSCKWNHGLRIAECKRIMQQNV